MSKDFRSWTLPGGDDALQVDSGQVWRACKREACVLVLILSVDGSNVLVAPVTIDPPGEDDQSLVLENSGFGVEATVWGGITASIPICVLDCPVDHWNDDLVRWVTFPTQRRSNTVPAGTRRGKAIQSEFDIAAQLRAELEDDLESLSQVPNELSLHDVSSEERS